MQLKEILSFPCGWVSTNAILLTCLKTKRCALIDPAQGSADHFRKIIALHQLQVERILITHSHWDHIVDCAQVAKEYKVGVYVHALDSANLEHPGTDGLPLFFLSIEGVKPSGFLKEGDCFQVGTLRVEVLHTPGHCPGLVCFYIPSLNTLICGDLFFRGSIGRIDLATAEPEKMWLSLKRVSQLPAQTMVYPGHGQATCIGQESWLSQAEQIFGR